MYLKHRVKLVFLFIIDCVKTIRWHLYLKVFFSFVLHRTQINFTVAIDFTASNGKISLTLIIVIVFDVCTEKGNLQHC